MRLSVAAAVAGLCASSHAFSDSSPFILFSTAKLSKPTSDHQLQSSSQVLETTKQLLSSCPTNRYLFISQPNLNAAHLSSSAAVPKLTESISHTTSSYSIAEVAGEFDVRSIATYIRETCELPQSSINVVELLPVPSSAAGSEMALKENDDELGMILEQYETSTVESYTVVYAGGVQAEKPQTYAPEFTDDGAGPTELKRQLHDVNGVRRQEKDGKNLPLFEKYQYFTPGIFMSLIVLIILMSILYAGISAVASLEVSYGAFDKEMGPAAQKKQQ
ncbi:ER protein BIG1 [Xylaria bambusicola]|uniref:ER protein BIG1 n=1 Tax=Xylaria bambusicola TaxID=326684 RepID=UPI002007FFF6|nr:ER protein BIG1 [Xylaria bambusicola]KAI0503306.1 ER protein BIG1 [Xylaria bambusicola]